MSVPGAEPTVRQPNWMDDFQAWVTRLSPAALADLIDVLAVELQDRNIGDHVAFGKTAAAVRKHHLTPSMPATVLGDAQTRPRTAGEARLTLLRERGVSLTDIARDLGRDLSAVSRVNRGQRRSQAIEREIARRLGLALPDAFPEWHRADPPSAALDAPIEPDPLVSSFR